jgi:hypothetical protein
MKTQSFKAVILSSLLATTSLFVVAQDQASDVDKLAQREAQTRVQSAIASKRVKALIASAKTPQDHLKLAAYFTQEADRLDADAKVHQELAEGYQQNPNTTGGGKQSGTGSIFRTAEHCDSAAKSLRDAARSLREPAGEHQRMAKDVAK